MARRRTCDRIALALVLVHCAFACLAKRTLNFTTDLSALLAFKAHITSDPHQFLSNWSVASSVCNWNGVTCGSRHHRVIALNVSNMDLAGTIPPQLGNLSFLAYLDFYTNHFYGNLPRELAHLRRLRFMDVGYNDLSEEIPGWLGSLLELRYLSLKNNSFSGPIPPSLFNLSKLEMLLLSNNAFEGMLPAKIANLQGLKILSIFNNQLSGHLPLQLFNISTFVSIELTGNSLSGSLPDQICRHLPRLEWLNLRANNLSGQIPSNYSQCSKLRVLDLSDNNFRGVISKDIGMLEKLEELYIGSNNLRGVIPKEIGNLTMLKILAFHHCNLTGEIPQEINNLYNLEEVYLQSSNLSGSASGIFNLSTLKVIALTQNHFSGKLLPSMFYRLPNLEKLYLALNDLDGVLPESISNASKLVILVLAQNKFSGSVPHSLGNLRLLETLYLFGNNFTSEASSLELGFINSLTKCRHLRELAISDNQLNGVLPHSIGNLSSSMQRLVARHSSIKGNIPGTIGNLSNLIQLNLRDNQLVGSIPTTIKGLEKLQFLSLAANQISRGNLAHLCDTRSLYFLALEENQILGSIPECLGNVTSLREIYLGSNRLNSSVPPIFWTLKDLLALDLSSNFLSGSLPPNIGGLKAVAVIDISVNSFSGELPIQIGDLQNLLSLSLANNKLQGSIPESIGEILSLEILDLSHNNFSGSIPKSLEALLSLSSFDISFNDLEGEIPSEGPFRNFMSQSFISNKGLCGASRFFVPPCPNNSANKPRKKRSPRLIFILLGIAAAISATIVGFVLLRYRKKRKVSGGTGLSSIATHERISYYELLQATNGYDESNLIGTGSFGSVYKGILNDGRTLAVKVFNMKEENELNSFEVECQVLRTLRHRNLVKVITSCSNPNFKALVLEFMPNGNLDKWLYSHNNFLDIVQRLNIMIDVAYALQYLHHGNSTPVVHCDLKPSNVLLDQDIVGHVSDFGIAKLLRQSSVTYTNTLATFGYISPEYGLEGLVSTRSDVYSYGIMLMEVFTRKKPNDNMFSESFNLRGWILDSMPDALVEVLDSNLLTPGEEYFTEKLDCLSSIMNVALNCTRESPRERSNMDVVVSTLTKIKLQLLPYHRRA